MTILIILVAVIAAVLTFVFLKKTEEVRIIKSFEMVLFWVTMPLYGTKPEEAGRPDEKIIIGQMEQVYTNFLYLRKPNFFERILYGGPRIALEIASQVGTADISFYVAVPRYLENAFAKYVQGVYPRAVVERVAEDYTIFEPGGRTAGAYLKLANGPFLPINTYKNFDKDPLAGLTNALSKIKADEGAAVQIIFRPAHPNWKSEGETVIQKIRGGKSAKEAMAESAGFSFLAILNQTLKVLLARKSGAEDRLKPAEIQIDEKTIQAIEAKIQKQVFEVNLRLLSSAQDQKRADEIIDHLESAFGQFSLIGLNNFETVRLGGKELKKLVYAFSFRNFSEGQKNILNIGELTSIYHFPTLMTETPYLKMAKTSEVAPPPELPTTGLNLIGRAVFRGDEKKVYFANRDDRRRHFYTIGQTGTGKTSLLREMIRQDIKNGEGVAVIDPHGELVEMTLANVPEERLAEVVLFEPFDLERPIGLNMLEYDSLGQKDFAVQEMIAIFYKLFPPEIIGPMFEHYMRNAMLALMADRANPGTLVEIPRIFTDEQFMEKKLMLVDDPLVRNFWLREWKQTVGATKSDMLGYVVSKVGRFVENEMMRNIIGQGHSGFDLGEIMNSGKIFLANLSKGLTGEVNSSLLGLILVSKMQMAAMKRARLSEAERKDFYLYIDEFQNFTTDSITTILSEARKYRLNLVMAHQYIPQLKEEIRNAVLGNVGAIAAFRLGASDAEFLEKQFEPEFSRFDLINLDNFDIIIKMLINNKVSSSFKVTTLPPQPGNPAVVLPIKKISRLKYGRPKELVEMEIIQRSSAEIARR